MCQEECTGINLPTRREGAVQEEKFFRIDFVVVCPSENGVGKDVMKVTNGRIMDR